MPIDRRSKDRRGKARFMEPTTPLIVIVEDNPDDSFWLNRELKKANLGISVKLFDNVLEAYNFLLNSPSLPAAVFLDLHLPITSGIELLRRMKVHPSLQRVLVFVLNGSSSPKEIEECEKFGVAAFLDKPVSLKDLTAKVIPRIRDFLTAKS